MLRSAFSRLATAVVVLSALSACRSANRPPFAVGPPLDETRRATTTGEVVGGAGRYGGWAWLGIPDPWRRPSENCGGAPLAL